LNSFDFNFSIFYLKFATSGAVVLGQAAVRDCKKIRKISSFQNRFSFLLKLACNEHGCCLGQGCCKLEKKISASIAR
jgi:hypothetical protein